MACVHSTVAATDPVSLCLPALYGKAQAEQGRSVQVQSPLFQNILGTCQASLQGSACEVVVNTSGKHDSRSPSIIRQQYPSEEYAKSGTQHSLLLHFTGEVCRHFELKPTHLHRQHCIVLP